MFSMKQKQEISEAVQKILHNTKHPELPRGEIDFLLRVNGAESWSWADIRNNGHFTKEHPPGINPHNEKQAINQNQRSENHENNKNQKSQ